MKNQAQDVLDLISRLVQELHWADRRAPQGSAHAQGSLLEEATATVRLVSDGRSEIAEPEVFWRRGAPPK